VLCQVQIDINVPLRELVFGLDGGNDVELDQTKKVSNYWPDEPPDDTLHVGVKLPDYGEWRPVASV
jgi:hypothetical protein